MAAAWTTSATRRADFSPRRAKAPQWCNRSANKGTPVTSLLSEPIIVAFDKAERLAIRHFRANSGRIRYERACDDLWPDQRGLPWYSDNDKGHRNRLTPPLDRTLTALVEDLDERGLLDSTLVIAMGEFGRTPIINANLGRDHWPNCWSLALSGGGIKTGQVVGASDERGANVTERVVSMGDLYATVYKALGI